MLCPECGMENKSGSKFCKKCGKPLNNVKMDSKNNICPECGMENKSGSKFCKKCGTSLIKNKNKKHKTKINLDLKKFNKKQKIGLITIIILILLAGVVGLYFTGYIGDYTVTTIHSYDLEALEDSDGNWVYEYYVFFNIKAPIHTQGFNVNLFLKDSNGNVLTSTSENYDTLTDSSSSYESNLYMSSGRYLDVTQAQVTVTNNKGQVVSEDTYPIKMTDMIGFDENNNKIPVKRA